MCLIQCMDDNIYIPEYTNRNLGINCMEIKIDDTSFFEVISYLSLERKLCMKKLY